MSQIRVLRAHLSKVGCWCAPLTSTHKFEEFFSLSPNLLKTFQKNVNTQTLSCGNTNHFAATFVDLLQAAR